MLPVKKKEHGAQLVTILIPTAFSICFILFGNHLLLISCVLSLFLVIGTVPLFKKRESLYMFLFVAVAGLPINIALACRLLSKEILGGDLLIGQVLWGGFLCCVFFSVEEIAFGVITRMIWKKQYKIRIDETEQ